VDDDPEQREHGVDDNPDQHEDEHVVSATMLGGLSVTTGHDMSMM
jgi:hypothetical protein